MIDCKLPNCFLFYLHLCFTYTYVLFIRQWSGINLSQFWELGEELGKGAYGSVYLARTAGKKDSKPDSKGNHSSIAIKVLSPEGLSDTSEIEKEIEILRKASKHPNIVFYYGTAKVDDKLWILMELLEGGSLRDMLDALQEPFNEDQV